MFQFYSLCQLFITVDISGIKTRNVECGTQSNLMALIEPNFPFKCYTTTSLWVSDRDCNSGYEYLL